MITQPICATGVPCRASSRRPGGAVAARASSAPRGVLSRFARALHASRVERRRAEGQEPPALEVALFGSTMAMVARPGLVQPRRRTVLRAGCQNRRSTGNRTLFIVAKL